MTTDQLMQRFLEQFDHLDMSAVERRVFNALKEHPEGLRRQQLVAIVFQETVTAGDVRNNNTKDRLVRDAVARLRDRLVPIISTSGRPGYRLDASPEARRIMIAELEHRHEKLTDLIRRARQFYQMEPPELPVQKILF